MSDLPDDINPTLEPGAARESLRDRLRGERRDLREAAQNLTLVVPSWPTIALRYKAISETEFEHLAKQIQRGKDGANILAVYRLIGRCFQNVLVRPSDEDPFEVLVDDAGAPFTLEPALAEYLDYEATNSTEVLKGLFSADKHPLAPATHGDALIDWMRGRGDEIDRALLGE